MSITALLTALKTPYGSPAKKSIMVQLANFANERTGRAWPSTHTLAAATEFAEATVRRALKELVRDGHLAVTRRQGRSSIYTLLSARQTSPNGVTTPTSPHEVASPPPVDKCRDTPVTVTTPPIRVTTLPLSPRPPILLSEPINNLLRAGTRNDAMEELERKGRGVGFRNRMPSESYERYRAAMDAHLKQPMATNLGMLKARLAEWRATSGMGGRATA